MVDICKIDFLISVCDVEKAEELFSKVPTHIDDEKTSHVLKAYSDWLKKDFSSAFMCFCKALQIDKRDLFICKRAQLMCLFGGFNEKLVEPPLLVEMECQGNSPLSTYLFGWSCFY